MSDFSINKTPSQTPKDYLARRALATIEWQQTSRLISGEESKVEAYLVLFSETDWAQKKLDQTCVLNWSFLWGWGGSYHGSRKITLCCCCRLAWLLCRMHTCFIWVRNLSETSRDISNRMGHVWKCLHEFSWVEWKHCMMIQHFKHTTAVTRTHVYMQTCFIWLGLFELPSLWVSFSSAFTAGTLAL